MRRDGSLGRGVPLVFRGSCWLAPFYFLLAPYSCDPLIHQNLSFIVYHFSGRRRRRAGPGCTRQQARTSRAPLLSGPMLVDFGVRRKSGLRGWIYLLHTWETEEYRREYHLLYLLPLLLSLLFFFSMFFLFYFSSCFSFFSISTYFSIREENMF